ncbi:MAG TPA: ImmA/IrrE family metallo-endopeptidase [Leptolyngbyaceae cyanobacterium M65_K2018_010]|nr:ImmA/IrrE family metallo-endopeptidase [Leptolyngbyaceae cyanobacterium M65_K2018_010]
MKISLQPTILRWARTRAGLSVEVLAQKMHVKPQRVIDWEENGELSFKQAEKLANITHTPFGYLYLPEPPQEALPINDFRTVGSEAVRHPSPDLLATLDQAQQIQSWFRDELIARGQEPLSFVGSLSQDVPIIEAANRIRQVVGFDENQQARTWEDALRQQIEQIENTGVLVLRNGIVGNNTHRPLSVDEFRGFALSDPYAPLIFINDRDAKAAQMFTLAHELVHIWVGVSGVSNLEKTYANHYDIERFCNQVAAELLVPAAELQKQWSNAQSQNDCLQSLSRRFKVSSLVILRRLNDSGLISLSTFQQRYQAEQARFQATASEQDGGGDFYRTQRSRLSRQFLRALIESTLEGRTPYRDALRLIGLSKVETFHELARDLAFSL